MADYTSTLKQKKEELKAANPALTDAELTTLAVQAIEAEEAKNKRAPLPMRDTGAAPAVNVKPTPPPVQPVQAPAIPPAAEPVKPAGTPETAATEAGKDTGGQAPDKSATPEQIRLRTRGDIGPTVEENRKRLEQLGKLSLALTEDTKLSEEEEKALDPKVREVRRIAQESKRDYQNALNKIKEFSMLAEKEYQQSKNTLKWAEAADIIGQAVAKMAAGYYGIKHGVDLSGQKFQPKDWSKDLDRLLSEYKFETEKQSSEGDAAQKTFANRQQQAQSLAKDLRSQLESTFESEDRVKRDLANMNLGIEEFNKAQKAKAEAEKKDSTDKAAEAERTKKETAISKAAGSLALWAEAPSKEKKEQYQKEAVAALTSAGYDGATLLEAMKQGEAEYDPTGPDIAYDLAAKFGVGTPRPDSPASKAAAFLAELQSKLNTTATTKTSKKVTLVAPDGSEKEVDESEVAGYVAKGARVKK